MKKFEKIVHALTRKVLNMGEQLTEMAEYKTMNEIVEKQSDPKRNKETVDELEVSPRTTSTLKLLRAQKTKILVQNQKV